MKTLNKIIILIIAVGFISSTTMAQDIISAREAGKLVNNENVVMVSARTPADYNKVHIPGAVNVNHSELYEEMSMLKPAAELGEILGAKGIDPNKKIVIYDDGSMKSSGRVYWILKYLGVKDVIVVDGGMKAWRIARLPVTRNPSNINRVTFIPRVNSSILASMNDVKKGQNDTGTILVDVRSPEEYKGTAPGNLRPGHIPSAVNLNYESILNSDGTLKSNSELAVIFNKVGITSNKKVILYCATSVRAGIVFLALKSGLNYANVSVYDGAYTEWQSVDSNMIGMVD